MLEKISVAFLLVAIGYSTYIYYDREATVQKLENAKAEAIVQKLDAKTEQFESNQAIQFENDKRRLYEEINSTIGKHTISFGVIRMQREGESN